MGGSIESQLATSFILTLGGGFVLYTAKKIFGWWFGWEDSSSWPCACNTMKFKRNCCFRCKSSRTNNTGKKWICNCGRTQPAKARKCKACSAYQVWHCNRCANPKSKKFCRKCKTQSHWRCSCHRNG